MPTFLSYLQDIVIAGLVSSGATLLILKFLGESLVKNALQKKIEVFKVQLQEKTEHLKTSLSIYAKEHEVSYQRVDAQRASAIHQVYQTISETSYLLPQIIQGPLTKNIPLSEQIQWYLTKSIEIFDSTTNFNEALRKNAIYFDNETYVMLHEYFLIAGTLTQDITLYLSNTEESKISAKEIEEKRKNLEIQFHEKLKPIHQKTTDSFRFILGIEKKRQFKEKDNITMV